MTKWIKNLMVLVGAVVILALALAAAAPVLAQEGTGGDNQGQQGGGTLVLEDDDTLGDVFEEQNFSLAQVREFFVLNSDLVLEEGQDVSFPQDAVVDLAAAGNTGDDAAGTAGTDSGTTSGTTDQSGSAAGTTDQSGTTGGTTDQSGQGNVTGDSGQDAGNNTQAAFVCEPGDLVENETTYEIVEGDTLGDVLMMIGFDAQTANTAGSAGTESGQAGAVSDQILLDFVNLNCDLEFADVSEQSVVLPAAIPQTGAEGEAGATGADSGANNVDQSAAGQATDVTGQDNQTDQQNQAGTDDQSGQQGQAAGGTYTVQAGESLIDIAARFGITLEELVRLNPDLVTAGETINVPAQEGNIPSTGTEGGTDQNQSGATGTDQNQQSQDDNQGDLTLDGSITLGELIDRWTLTEENDLRSFFAANRGLKVEAGQVVQLPEGMTLQNNADDQANNYTTQDGDTLGGILDNIQTGWEQDQNQAGGQDDQSSQNNASLGQFVNLNRGLVISEGQTVVAPESIPQTGAENQGATGNQNQGAAGNQNQGNIGNQNQDATGNQTGQSAIVGNFPSLMLHLDEKEMNAGQGLYIVQSGDTLSSIARKFDTEVSELYNLNPNLQGDLIFRGQRLVVPAVENPVGGWNLHLRGLEQQNQAQGENAGNNGNNQ